MRLHLHILCLAFAGLLTWSASYAQKKSRSDEISYKDRLKFERLYIDASKAKILSDYEQAAKLYEDCKKIDPQAPAPHYELANLYLHSGQLQDAMENAKFAAEKEPTNSYFRLMYAETLKAAKEIRQAAVEYKKIIDDFPTQYTAYLDLASIRIYLKEPEKAIDVYDQLEKAFGPLEEVKLKKQFLYLQMGKVDDAANEIEALIELFPDNVRYYLLLAEIYNANDMDDKCLKAYKQAAQRFPENAEIHLSMTMYYNGKKQYKKGLEHIKIAFESPELDIDTKVQALLALFDIAGKDGGYKENLVELGGILLKVHPNNAKVLTINGDVNLNLGNPKVARNYFQKAVEIDGSKYPIWSQLLILEAELEIFDTLVIHGRQAAELFPNQPLCFYFAGYGNSRLKKYKEAVESYERGLKLIVDNDPLKVQFLLGMADSYNENGEYEKSDESFEKILKMEPNNTVALNNYSYYLSERGEKLEQALAMSKKSNNIEANSATYLDTYAWILYKLERYEEANIQIDKALKFGGSSSGVILEHKGDICFKLNQLDQAMDFWNKAKQTGETSGFIDQKLKDRKLYE